MRSFTLLTLLVLFSGCKSGDIFSGNWPPVLSEMLIVNLDSRPASGIREMALETTRVEARRSLDGNWIEISQTGSPRPPSEPTMPSASRSVPAPGSSPPMEVTLALWRSRPIWPAA